jgi:hypothetical protein
MSGPCNNTGIVENKRRTAACSIHTDNNYSTWDNRRNSRLEIQNLVPGLRRSERQNAARERKPIHLPSMRLREAFSSVFSSWLLFCEGGQTSKPRIPSTLREFMPPSNRTDADDLAVAVVLTLELAKIVACGGGAISTRASILFSRTLC